MRASPRMPHGPDLPRRTSDKLPVLYERDIARDAGPCTDQGVTRPPEASMMVPVT